MALAGDTTAMRLCLDRIYPARKDTPVTFEMPHWRRPPMPSKRWLLL